MMDTMTNLDEFISPKLRPRTLDIYFVRNAIFAALNQVLPFLSGTLLDVGCGQMPYRDFILSHGRVTRYLGLDLENNALYRNAPDITWDGETVPLPENSVDCVTATELLEHCPEPDGTLTEIFRVLQPGGYSFSRSLFSGRCMISPTTSTATPLLPSSDCWQEPVLCRSG